MRVRVRVRTGVGGRELENTDKDVDRRRGRQTAKGVGKHAQHANRPVRPQEALSRGGHRVSRSCRMRGHEHTPDGLVKEAAAPAGQALGQVEDLTDLVCHIVQCRRMSQ